ncbi:unnamed protein product [Calypogeia fissa]
MTPTRAAGGGAWMAGNSSVRISGSGSIPGLEDDPRWRPITSCSSPTSNEASLIKDCLPPSSSFSKGILDEDWYTTPENSLMDEMKELSYASSLPSQQQGDNVGSSHFNLESPHLQSFLTQNISRPCGGLDNRSNLANFLDGGGGLPFDGSGGNAMMSNFSRQTAGGPGSLGGGNTVMLEPQSGNGNNSSLVGGLLPSLGHIVHNNLLGNRNSTGLLLNNLSPNGSSMGDGGFNTHTHNLGGNLSSILSSGITSFTNAGGNSLGSPFSSSLGLGASSSAMGSVGSLGGGDGFNNAASLSSRNLMGGHKDNNSMPMNLERSSFRSSKNMLTLDGASASPSTGGSQQQQQQQTLFQKRAASRHSVPGGAPSPTLKSPPQVVTSASNDSSLDMPDEESPNIKGNINSNSVLPSSSSMKDGRRPPQPVGAENMVDFGMDDEQQLDQDDDKDDDDMDESGDGSGVLYETDDTTGMERGAAGGAQALLQGGGVPGEKGKGKKGLPAKNLMAERRRRKKLNDRLYMLRSVVPKITKMDRASILGDAIEYLKELLQRINDLHTELEATPAERPPPPSPPALPAPVPNLASRVKEEPPSSLPSPDAQQARVEVRTREGRALNIHMFCQRKPGLLLSTMRALDGLGLDVQQAVISCFNGFALDVFKAEQSKEADVGPDEIKAVLLHTAGSNINTPQ